MSLHAQIAQAARLAGQTIAGIQSGRRHNLTGPCGQPYTAVFRGVTPADGLNAEQLTAHGYDVKIAQVVAISKDQFSDMPTDWVEQGITKLSPDGSTQLYVVAAKLDDDFFYYFTAVGFL